MLNFSKLIEENLEGVEREIFEEMHPYDKKHSVNVLKGVLKSNVLREDKLYIRLALLHDCGKDVKTTFGQRVKYSLFKVGRIHFHPKRGYEKLTFIDKKMPFYKKLIKHSESMYSRFYKPNSVNIEILFTNFTK